MARQTTKKAITQRAKPRTSTETFAAKRTRFLTAMRETPNVSRAARLAGMNPSTAYRHRAKNRAFREAWDAAVSAALDTIEEVLLGRIIDGVERPHFYAGNQTGTYKVYSDNLLMFYLRAHRPEIYGRTAASGGSEDSGDDREVVMRQLARLADRAPQGRTGSENDDEPRAD